MQGFKLDTSGDIVIENGKIAMTSGDDLIAQTIRSVLNINKGEWFLNENEGINFYAMLGKGVTDDGRLSQIKDAVSQVNGSLQVVDFGIDDDTQKRTSRIEFSVKDEYDNIIAISETYGEETGTDASAKLALANAALTDYRVANEKLARRIDGR